MALPPPSSPSAQAARPAPQPWGQNMSPLRTPMLGPSVVEMQPRAGLATPLLPLCPLLCSCESAWVSGVRGSQGKAMLGEGPRAGSASHPSSLPPAVCLCGVPGDSLRGHVPQSAPEERAAGAPHSGRRGPVLPDRALPGYGGELGCAACRLRSRLREPGAHLPQLLGGVDTSSPVITARLNTVEPSYAQLALLVSGDRKQMLASLSRKGSFLGPGN